MRNTGLRIAMSVSADRLEDRQKRQVELGCRSDRVVVYRALEYHGVR
jgi:hypothetical protein